MELLVVIAIIAVLAGLGITVSVKVQENTKKQKTKAQIKQIENAIQEYHLDFGVYPVGDSDPNQNSKRLFECLFEGKDENGEEVGNNPECYATFLDPNGPGKSFVTDDFLILDPFDNPYHYLDADSGTTNNPDFDLWSIGKDAEDATNDDMNNW